MNELNIPDPKLKLVYIALAVELMFSAKQACLAEFKKHVKACAGCGKDLRNEANPLAASIPGSTDVNLFCSQFCQARCAEDNSLAAAKAPSVKNCETCAAACDVELLAANALQLDGVSHHFCGAPCLATFRRAHERDVPCEWCGARRCNFDMIERLDPDGHVQLFCSLNCLSLYRVNQQANSGQSVMCDQCRSLVPAQYHLTMSDASVRNFCSYTCVAAFQAQFAAPTSAAVAAPTPGQKVTANTASATTAPAAATGKYGTRQSTRGELQNVCSKIKLDLGSMIMMQC